MARRQGGWEGLGITVRSAGTGLVMLSDVKNTLLLFYKHVKKSSELLVTVSCQETKSPPNGLSGDCPRRKPGPGSQNVTEYLKKKKKRFYLFIFRERGRDGEREGEEH